MSSDEPSWLYKWAAKHIRSAFGIVLITSGIAWAIAEWRFDNQTTKYEADKSLQLLNAETMRQSDLAKIAKLNDKVTSSQNLLEAQKERLDLSYAKNRELEQSLSELTRRLAHEDTTAEATISEKDATINRQKAQIIGLQQQLETARVTNNETVLPNMEKPVLPNRTRAPGLPGLIVSMFQGSSRVDQFVTDDVPPFTFGSYRTTERRRNLPVTAVRWEGDYVAKKAGTYRFRTTLVPNQVFGRQRSHSISCNPIVRLGGKLAPFDGWWQMYREAKRSYPNLNKKMVVGDFDLQPGRVKFRADLACKWTNPKYQRGDLYAPEIVIEVFAPDASRYVQVSHKDFEYLSADVDRFRQ